jgi:hypothetical protein
VRELFCAMRIDLATFSTTCLLFDHLERDLTTVLKTLEQNFNQMPIWHNPLAVLAMLAGECGRTSDERRRHSDDEILQAETATNSTLWENPRPVAIWNYEKLRRTLHICRNILTFIDHAVAFEIDVWNFLQSTLKGKDVNDVALFEQLDQVDRQFFTDTVSFKLQYTMNRKLQIAGLQVRVKVQQSVVCTLFQSLVCRLTFSQVDNLIMGQDGNRTLMISILVALFASISLIAVGPAWDN